MKDGAILANSGTSTWRSTWRDWKKYRLGRGPSGVCGGIPVEEREKDLCAGGRSVDQPGRGRRASSSVMDMSFANQALAAEFMVKNRGKLERKFTGPCRHRPGRSPGSS